MPQVRSAMAKESFYSIFIFIKDITHNFSIGQKEESHGTMHTDTLNFCFASLFNILKLQCIIYSVIFPINFDNFKHMY